MALRMTSVTAWGWEIMITCDPSTSVILAPARWAMDRMTSLNSPDSICVSESNDLGGSTCVVVDSVSAEPILMVLDIVLSMAT
jgi:hypothetical protein